MQLGKKMDWKEVMEGILVVVFVALFIRTFLLTNYKVPTNSMVPLLHPGDFFLGSRLHGSFKVPFTHKHVNPISVQKDDVVTFRLTEDSRILIARRVMALENDLVEVKDGGLYLNGERKRDVVSDTKDLNLKIPEGQFFAVCESAQLGCEDSLNWGALPLNQIQSKALFVWLSVGDDAFHLHTERIGPWVTLKNP